MNRLIAALRQDIASERFRRQQRSFRAAPHPTGENLYHYALGWLPEGEAAYLRQHLLFCERCAAEVARIIGIEQRIAQRTASAPPLDLRDALATEFWEPQWAGQLATAADIPAQEHTFFLDDGQIMLSCRWGGECGSEPAFIWIRWESRLHAEHAFSVHFIHPETQLARYETSLGSLPTGEATFISRELGFDPATERWAIGLSITVPTREAGFAASDGF